MWKILFIIVSCAELATSEPIVGGGNVTEMNYRFVVYLYVTNYEKDEDGNRTDYYQECSGSLIHESIVLTAAHCIDSAIVPSKVKVFGGKPTKPRQRFYFNRFVEYALKWEMEDFVIHPFYEVLYVDVALLYLQESERLLPGEVNIGYLFKTIPVPLGKAVLTGFGLMDDSNSSDTLRETVMEIYEDHPACTQIGKIYFGIHFLCAIDRPEFNTTTCDGDAGGPVIMHDEIVGIIAAGIETKIKRWGYGEGGIWTFESCNPSEPALLISVPHVKSWIMRNIPQKDWLKNYGLLSMAVPRLSTGD